MVNWPSSFDYDVLLKITYPFAPFCFEHVESYIHEIFGCRKFLETKNVFFFKKPHGIFIFDKLSNQIHCTCYRLKHFPERFEWSL